MNNHIICVKYNIIIILHPPHTHSVKSKKVSHLRYLPLSSLLMGPSLFSQARGNIPLLMEDSLTTLQALLPTYMKNSMHWSHCCWSVMHTTTDQQMGESSCSCPDNQSDTDGHSKHCRGTWVMSLLLVHPTCK